MKSLLNLLIIVAILHFTGCNISTKSKSPVTDKLETPIDTWHINHQEGGISWDVNAPHTDNLEFSGLQVSAIIYYGTDSLKDIVLNKKIVWPMLRTIPNDTHASLIHDFGKSENAMIEINGEVIKHEKPYRIDFSGVLTISSKIGNSVDIERVLSPSTDKPAVVELVTLTNISDKDVEIKVGKLDYLSETPADKGVYGAYEIRCYNKGAEVKTLKKGETYTFSQFYMATKRGEKYIVDVKDEIQKRNDFINSLNESLILETPDVYINRMFSFAKLRAVESIFATKGGLMHAPGGSRYYAAIWANDQAEYVNPFFPFLGNENGDESAINSFRHFARFMNDQFEPIPSSIIAEGTDIWNGAGDRGDAAMIAYGASRFALAYGDKEAAESLLPLI